MSKPCKWRNRMLKYLKKMNDKFLKMNLLISIILFLSTIRKNCPSINANNISPILILLITFVIFESSFLFFHYSSSQVINIRNKIVRLLLKDEIEVLFAIFMISILITFMPFSNIYLGYFIFGSFFGIISALAKKKVKDKQIKKN